MSVGDKANDEIEHRTALGDPIGPDDLGHIKNPAAVALGKLGGAKGGRVRAARQTPAERSAIARAMANKRWAKDDPPAPAQRTRRPDLQLTERILEAATQMFRKSGYAGVAMRDLAKIVGTSLSRIYANFPEKEALYQECCLRMYDDYRRTVEDKIVLAKTDEETILAFAIAFCRYQTQSSTHMTVMRHHINREEGVLRQITALLFSGQFKTLEAAAFRILGDKIEARERTYALYCMIFGYYQLSPYAESAKIGLPTQLDPDLVAFNAVKNIFPSIPLDGFTLNHDLWTSAG